MILGDAPGWTAADSAELDVLLQALAVAFFEHRERCATCLEGRVPCPSVRNAIREVCDWREARILLSRAQALRIDQELAA